MWLQIPFFLCVIFLGVICEYVLNNKNKMDRWSPLSSNVKLALLLFFRTEQTSIVAMRPNTWDHFLLQYLCVMPSDFDVV